MKNNNKTGNTPFVSRFYLNNHLVTEKIESESSLRFLYENCIGRYFRRLLRMRWWSKLFGVYKNSRYSKKSIKNFVEKHNIIMTDFERPIEQYHSFNDFFCRKLKPEARPIDPRENTIISPADAKLLVFPKISAEMKFFVKTLPFNLETFLQSKKLATDFNNGIMMIFRLAPYDYHRYHFPIAGNAHTPQEIRGQYESVNPLVYANDVQPLTGNQRYLISLDNTPCGSVLMIPVGAMCAGKIVNTYQANQHQEKGQEAGYFAFGGSTVVLLFKQDTIRLLDTFITHSQEGFETAIKMGEVIAERI